MQYFNHLFRYVLILHTQDAVQLRIHTTYLLGVNLSIIIFSFTTFPVRNRY